jgi:hypothetical protein
LVKVTIVCAFFAMSSSRSGMRSARRETRTVGSVPEIRDFWTGCLLRYAAYLTRVIKPIIAGAEMIYTNFGTNFEIFWMLTRPTKTETCGDCLLVSH